MKSKWIYVILVTLFAVFFLNSCLPLSTSSKEVSIVIDRSGINRNATLVLAQDGLNGEWKELTGTDGKYKFTVNDPDGVYSIVAVDKSGNSSDIELFHSTLAERKAVNIEFQATPETDFATLTINLPATYEASQVTTFFRQYVPGVIKQSSVTVQIPKSKSDLVVFIGTKQDSSQKVYIKRDFEIKNAETVNIEEKDLKTLESLTTSDIYYFWIINNTHTLPVVFNKKIPNMATNDRYLAVYGDLLTGKLWFKVTKDVPVSLSDKIKNFTPPTTTIISDKKTDSNGLPEITFIPYESTISDYKTRLYTFSIYKFGSPSTHTVNITPGYLTKVGNKYKFPNITLSQWKDEYKPARDYTIQNLMVFLSPNQIEEFSAFKLGTEYLAFGIQ